jgi:sec-independent protein translocase protein TatA
MQGFSLAHIIVIGLIVLILFGSNKLPVFGQSLGKAIKGFKDGLNEVDVDSKDVSHKQLNSNQADINSTADKNKTNTHQS